MVELFKCPTLREHDFSLQFNRRTPTLDIVERCKTQTHSEHYEQQRNCMFFFIFGCLSAAIEIQFVRLHLQTDGNANNKSSVSMNLSL